MRASKIREDERRAVVLWSGGKDCTLATYRALMSGVNVLYLINIRREDGKCAHALKPEIIIAQSEAVGTPLILRETSSESYGSTIMNTLAKLKEKENLDTLIYGSMDKNSRELLERKCSNMGLKCIRPMEDHRERAKEVIALGFDVIVIRLSFQINKKWLGRCVDSNFIHQLLFISHGGDYHTFVIDGPDLFFSKKNRNNRN